MPLTEQQEAALPILEWLIGGDRRSGRTFILAIAIIRSACRNPGTPVYLIDHHDNHNSSQHHMYILIRRLLDESPLPRYASVLIERGQIIVHSPEPFGWAPNFDSLDPGGAPGPPPIYRTYQGTSNEPSMGTRVENYGFLRTSSLQNLNFLLQPPVILDIGDDNTTSTQESKSQESKSALQRILEDLL